MGWYFFYCKTKEGLKRIDEIEEGDLILAKDIQTGEINYKPVITVYRRITNKLVILNVEGEEIKTTPTHLFFDNGWWKVAENLECPKRIYNLNIDEYHTYFVSSLSFEIPIELANLRDLFILDLRGNKITDVPEEIRQLPKLDELNI